MVLDLNTSKAGMVLDLEVVSLTLKLQVVSLTLKLWFITNHSQFKYLKREGFITNRYFTENGYFTRSKFHWGCVGPRHALLRYQARPERKAPVLALRAVHTQQGADRRQAPPFVWPRQLQEVHPHPRRARRHADLPVRARD